jgi:hypothetical protein
MRLRHIGDGSVGEGEMPQCRHARFWEVRQSRSTREAGEQSWTSNSRGVRGGKETEQGERQAVVTGPDSESGLPGRADCLAYETHHFLFKETWPCSNEDRHHPR